MYMRRTRAMPETMAEKRNTIGMRGVDHHGFAFTDPKMKPTYPCNRNAEGMPIRVTSQPTRSSRASAPSEMFREPRVRIR
jgi:hypothetical protein